MKKLTLVTTSFIAALTLAIAGCGGSSNSTSSSSPAVAGHLEFVPGSVAHVPLNGGAHDVILDLVGASGVVGQEVTFSIEDPSVAIIYRPRSFKCALSSISVKNSECTIQIKGERIGSTILTATSPGYETKRLEIVTTNAQSVSHGQISVRSGATDGGRQISSGVATHTYASATGEAELTTKLVNSSGVTNATFSFELPKGATAYPATCKVTSKEPDCVTRVKGLPRTENATSLIMVKGSAPGGKIYDAVTINAVAKGAAPATNGKIWLSTNSGEENGFMPQGIKYPVYLTPEVAYSSADTVTLSLEIQVWNSQTKTWMPWSEQASPASFYYYGHKSNVTPKQYGGTADTTKTSDPEQLKGVPNCTMTLYTDTLSNPYNTCGYGLWANPANPTGTIQIVPTVTNSSSSMTYTLEPLAITVTTDDIAARTITFSNTGSNHDVWLALAPGMALAYAAPETLAVNINGANNAYCGNSASPANTVACPSGSSCKWTGAGYASVVAYQCVYDPGTLANSWSGSGVPGDAYKLNKAGSANAGNTVTHTISAYAYQNPVTHALDANRVRGAYNPAKPAQYSAGTYWSGAYVPRTGCNTSTGVCDVGSCGVADFSCPPGVNPQNILTKSEPAYQKYDPTGSAEMDEYDVSIIAGANVSAAFVPTSTNLKRGYSGSAYYCGMPGITQGQQLGVAGSTYNSYSPTAGMAQLPQSTWNLSAGISTTSFPNPVSSTALAKSYYRLVKVKTGDSGAACDATAQTPGQCANTNEVCGTTLQSVTTSSTPALQCASETVGWITPNQLLSLNPLMSSAVFFTNPASGWTSGYETIQNYQLCEGTTFTAYSTSSGSTALNACGGVAWGNTETPPYGGSQATGQQVVTSSQSLGYKSSNWMSAVFPTIAWLKQACPTCYSFPFDDPTSTFSCAVSSGSDNIEYSINFGDVQ